MKRSLAALVLVVLLAAACGSGGGSDARSGAAAAPSGPMKIGVVGPMTGLAAFVGKNMVEGIELAVEDLNAEGGVTGREVEFVIRDDENDPSRTATAVRELIEKEDVSAIFGPAGAANYLSISRVIQDEGIPTWSIVAGPEIANPVNRYAFRAYLPDTLEISALAEFASGRYERVGVLAGNEADGESFRQSTKAALAEFRMEPVAMEAFAQDETDFSPIALKFKEAGADAIILGTHLGLFASRLAVAMENLDYDAQILGVAGLINYTYPDLARGAADGTIFISFRSWGHLPRDQWPASVREFYDRYVEEYLPEGEFSDTGAFRAYSTNFLTYDSVRIWAAAAEEAGSGDPEAVTETLNSGFEYPAEESVIGVPYSYTADDHDGIRPGDLLFYRWELGDDGQFDLVPLGTVTEVLSGDAEI